MAEAPVRSGPTGITATAATQYTVPATAGGYAILRTIHVDNTTTAGITLRMSIGAMAPATSLYYDIPIPANGALDWAGFMPLAASETVQVQGGAAGLTITLGLVTGP